jgi:hypothetical protein
MIVAARRCSWTGLARSFFSSLAGRFFFWTPFVILLEMYGRFLGFLDYRFKLKNHTIWDVTPSTKELLNKKK